MIRYLAFLRGINVGGNKIVKMERLREVLNTAELYNVQTYIQSGNVIFDSDIEDRALLTGQIEAAIKDAFGFEVKTLLRTAEELQAVVAQNPFAERLIDKNHKLYITFLPTPLAAEQQALLTAAQEGVEASAIIDRTLYVYWLRQPGKALEVKDAKAKKLLATSTTRDWTVVTALVERFCSA
jgi:uncharacterized protein (DUF1697 family)